MFFIRTPAANPQTNTPYKIFQFPADKIPRIDGMTSDWAIVPDDYAITMDRLHDDRPDSIRHKTIDKKNLDVTIKVGWVNDKNMSAMDAWFSFQGAQAQNCHIFTPPLDKKWEVAVK